MIDREAMAAADQNPLDLGSEQETIVPSMPIEGLDAEAVSRQQQRPVVRIEVGDTPHAIEPLERLDAPRPERTEHDFGVAARAKAHAEAFELATQVGVVVDLAVVYKHLAAGSRDHRLVAGARQVLDGEPHAPKRDSGATDATAPRALAVGAAVRLHLYHL